jgi:hypothetical protein
MEARKFQNPKSQIPNKSEIPISNDRRVWFEILNLGIEVYLLFGACDLVLDDSLQGVAL